MAGILSSSLESPIFSVISSCQRSTSGKPAPRITLGRDISVGSSFLVKTAVLADYRPAALGHQTNGIGVDLRLLGPIIFEICAEADIGVSSECSQSPFQVNDSCLDHRRTDR